MGYIVNHAIVVTATYGDNIAVAHAKAVEIFGQQVSSIASGTVNGSRSFFIAPDGSKEGWGDSDTGDRLRSDFKAWLRSKSYEDGSSPYDWAELTYGGDDDGAFITDSCHEDGSAKV